MGSQGWVACWHCWQDTWDPYIIDGINHPLCEFCWDRLHENLRPWYQPDNLARASRYMHHMIFNKIWEDSSEKVLEDVMSFIVRHVHIPWQLNEHEQKAVKWKTMVRFSCTLVLSCSFQLRWIAKSWVQIVFLLMSFSFIHSIQYVWIHHVHVWTAKS